LLRIDRSSIVTELAGVPATALSCCRQRCCSCVAGMPSAAGLLLLSLLAAVVIAPE
jgi:hypothetical protein